jgi:hypothetical protein
MQRDSLQLLVEPTDIHAYVDALWSDGPIRRSHRSGGLVHRLVDRFAALPRLFFAASDQHHEWTHFSPWWGAILLCDYENPTIRDLRYLHEIYHAATIPHIAGLRHGAMAARSFANEREASTFTEIAIYLELPDLRPLTFPHPIFADRLLFPGGDLATPDPILLDRWRADRRQVFGELMYRRLDVVLAQPEEIDPHDPQLVWLRRYAEQGNAWVEVWRARHTEVDAAMVRLREGVRIGDRRGAAERWRDWLLSDAVTGGGDIPFEAEARRFRTTFDSLLASYDAAMTARNLTAIRHA